MKLGKRLVVPVVLCLMIVLAFASAASASMTHSQTAQRAAWPSCTQEGALNNTAANDDAVTLQSYTFIGIQQDSGAHYCGYMQAVTKIAKSNCFQGDEPLNYARIALHKSDGSLLGGYTWSVDASQSGWAKCGAWPDNNWWYFYGPSVFVGCGVSVHAYSSWLEPFGVTEHDIGANSPSEGYGVSGTTANYQPC